MWSNLPLFAARDNPSSGKAGWRCLGDPKGTPSEWLGAYVSALDSTGNPPALVETPKRGKTKPYRFVVVGAETWVFCVRVVDGGDLGGLVRQLEEFLGRQSTVSVPSLSEADFGGVLLASPRVVTGRLLGVPRAKVEEWVRFENGSSFARKDLDLVTRGAGLGEAGGLSVAASKVGEPIFVWPSSSAAPIDAPWFCAFSHQDSDQSEAEE